MKSILYIHNGYLDSEKANIIQVINMCHSFSNEGIKVELILNKSKNKLSNIDEYVKSKFGFVLNFKIKILDLKKRLFNLNKYIIDPRIKKIIKESNHQYLFLRSPLYIKLGIRFKKKIIFESHNNILHNRFKLIDILWKNIISRSINNKNFVLFLSISKSLNNYWKNYGLNSKKCYYYHDGFNLENFKNIKDQTFYRRELSLPLKDKIITYTGSLYQDRDIDLIINLAKEFTNYFFCVVGGPESSKLYYRNICIKNNLKNIIFIGRVDHSKINSYLFASNVLLALWSKNVKTINYCSPLKLFEYMASGINILTQNHKTIMEVVNEKTAYIYNYYSVSDMKKKLLSAVNDEKMIVGLNARKQAFKKYSWKSRVKYIIKIIVE